MHSTFHKAAHPKPANCLEILEGYIIPFNASTLVFVDKSSDVCCKFKSAIQVGVTACPLLALLMQPALPLMCGW